MTHRNEQLESSLRRVLATIISQQVHDPRLRGLISVTKVDVSPDRRDATVFVSVVPEQYEARALRGLQAARGHIRKKAAGAVRTRVMPALTFKLDRSIKKQAAVEQAIRQAGQRRSVDDQADSQESSS